MKIRPLHDRLIVKRLEEERKTASGIVIPDSAAEKPDQGEVKAIGKGKVLEDGKVRAIDRNKIFPAFVQLQRGAGDRSIRNNFGLCDFSEFLFDETVPVERENDWGVRTGHCSKRNCKQRQASRCDLIFNTIE